MLTIYLMDYFSERDIKDALENLKNETITKCIIYLAKEDREFHSFQRGLAALITRRNDNDLSIVESSFQLTIDEIKNLRKTGFRTWTQEKTGLYLYTLQYIILNLDKIKLLSQKNTYEPQLAKKINNIESKCRKLGISTSLVRQQCYDTDYQFSNVKTLSNFGLINIYRLEKFNERLNKYALTHNDDDLYEENSRPKLTKTILNSTQNTISHEQYETAIGTLCRIIANNLHLAKIDLNTYNEHYIQINNEIRKLWKQRHADSKNTNHVIDAFKKYLQAKENDPYSELGNI